ncbi:aldo/keto reductase [Agromyces seonyuensis]|uniref:Aldo/keto reductase n=1 Tax=Agromyces seonyuensis TaxID=2662446 RepID=A0A6I4NSN5_9MICO|nr:aldo/keto reductase [Agromyces seonyuensis]MWB97466.1 aldo/keto reductase [Agromyces seonyuensis]
MSAPAPLLPLSDGRTIPQVGFGTYKIPAEDTGRLCLDAIDAGYRHLDTAALYGNEAGVGEAVRAAADRGVARDELFVTSKVWNADHGFDETLRAFEHSMDLLGLDRLDLYLIHWPVPSADRYVDTWRALVRLREEGRVASIGVSNFHAAHLQRLDDETGVLPVVDQVECHPWLPQTGLSAWCAERGILIEAWSPLARGRVIGDATPPVLRAIADKHGRTAAQVVLRWHVQHGRVLLPKASSPARIAENLALFDFELDDDDLAGIAGLESGERTGRNPDFD